MKFAADLLKSFIGHLCAAKIICDKSCFEQCTNGNVMCNVAWRNAQLGTEKRTIRHGEMRNQAWNNTQLGINQYAIRHQLIRN